MSSQGALITNLDEAAVQTQMGGDHWGASSKVLTAGMRERGGTLGVRWLTVPPGRTACPFHTHQREDEVFIVLEGQGTLRYGDTRQAIRAGDCISCPAGTGVAHQIANTSDEALVYLAIGTRDPHEVCTYPDSGKVMVRSLSQVGFLEPADYLAGEPEIPRVFEEGGPEEA